MSRGKPIVNISMMAELNFSAIVVRHVKSEIEFHMDT